MHVLVAEAMKKAAIVWIATGDGPAFGAWCLPADDALYLVSGGTEQPAPGLVAGAVVTVAARGDHGGRIASWRASAEQVAPGTEAWDTIAPQLASKRLNSTGPAEALVAKWVTDSAIFRLTRADEDVTGSSATAGSGAAVPLPTPATTRVPKPFRLHKVKRR